MAALRYRIFEKAGMFCLWERRNATDLGLTLIGKYPTRKQAEMVRANLRKQRKAKLQGE